MTSGASATLVTPETVGNPLADVIPVELSTRFLQHFSEQLYSSPQKAFEELISNGWDAGADYVDVRVSSDLNDPNATLCVLDNGVSMDVAGLRSLWHIALSPKAEKDEEHGRKLIGKFGIGKLATYVLATKLTYICKASDGIIRRVTMDYGHVDQGGDDQAGKDKLLRDLKLPVYEVSETDLKTALGGVDNGPTLLKLIDEGITAPAQSSAIEEFGGDGIVVTRASTTTWTLAILSDLKPTGRELRVGVLKRMLEAALPFGSLMAVCLNGDRLASSKLDVPELKIWRIGTDLGIDSVVLNDNGAPAEDEDEDIDASAGAAPAPAAPAAPAASAAAAAPMVAQYIPVTQPQSSASGASESSTQSNGTTTAKKSKPKPTKGNKVDKAEKKDNEPKKQQGTVVPIKSEEDHVEIPGLGKITGRVVLFQEKISGGKSDELGASNGFHVNVRGRVVNQQDPSFGEQNLSHAAWARFRMTVRCDGLNPFLTTDREKFRNRHELRLFRAFLRKVFNVARKHYDSDENAAMDDGGDVLVKSLGVLSLNPLRSVVSETLKEPKSAVPGLFDENGISDRKEKRKIWRAQTSDNIKSALGQIKFETTNDDTFVKFRISDSAIVINRDHPFVTEHSRTKAEKELMRTIAMVQLLSDVFLIDIGADVPTMKKLRGYRDRLMRFRAMQRRKSGTHLAKLLRDSQHRSDSPKMLEVAVKDALGYLGFDVKYISGSGEPEGTAKAYPMPTKVAPTDADASPPLYSFTFDAKSSKHENAKTGNVSLDGVDEHRKRHGADYALVVAPGFSEGALTTRCTELKITPMRAKDLGRLLEYTAEHGAIGLDRLRQVFAFYDPDKVTEWVDQLGATLKKGRRLTIDVFLKALDHLKGKIPDALAPSTIALTCREQFNAKTVQEKDVLVLVKGLEILIPDLVGIEGEKIVVNASATRVAEAVKAQLEKLHDDSDPADPNEDENDEGDENES